MTSALPPSPNASLPPDTPAPQRSSPLAPLLRLWEAWKSFAHAMGGFQSRILLGLFYFFVVTPFGLAVRAFGDPLLLSKTRGSSRWMARAEEANANLDQARKQF